MKLPSCALSNSSSSRSNNRKRKMIRPQTATPTLTLLLLPPLCISPTLQRTNPPLLPTVSRQCSLLRPMIRQLSSNRSRGPCSSTRSSLHLSARDCSRCPLGCCRCLAAFSARSSSAKAPRNHRSLSNAHSVSLSSSAALQIVFYLLDCTVTCCLCCSFDLEPRCGL